jgi:hypothetical protein
MAEEQATSGRHGKVIDGPASDHGARRNTESLRLDKLFDAVCGKVQHTLQQIENSQRSLTSYEIDMFVKINDILLQLCHWRDDIKVDNADPLEFVEDDTAGFEILARRLRADFNTLLDTLAWIDEQLPLM